MIIIIIIIRIISDYQQTGAYTGVRLIQQAKNVRTVTAGRMRRDLRRSALKRQIGVKNQ